MSSNFFAKQPSHLNLFQNINSNQIEEGPFPHAVVTNCLEKELADTLAREFPKMETFTRGKNYPPNHKIFQRCNDLMSDVSLSQIWKDFVKTHCALNLHHEIDRLFGKMIEKKYPDFNNRFGLLKEQQLELRDLSKKQQAPICLDVEAVIHTPSPEKFTIERKAHVKGNNKIAELHYFLRDEDDKEGDCELCLFGRNQGHETRFGKRNQTSEEGLFCAKKIPYQSNTAFLFLGGPECITKISARKSSYPFQYFIVVFQLNAPLFSLPTFETVSDNG